MDISVIIVNYNTRELLKNCLKSLEEHTKDVDYEIIVVDNGSHDGSGEMLRQDFPEVRLIESGMNLGFGKANNLGSENAKGDYLFYLNSDTIVKNNALKFFLDFARQHQDIGAVGAILKAANGENCHSHGKFLTPELVLKNDLARFIRSLKDPKHLHPDNVTIATETDYITGAAFLVPARVYKKTRGFDPDYFMYCEEMDWQKRIAETGLKRYVIPGPEIIHLEGGSDPSKTGIWSFNRLKNYFIAQKIYYGKNFPKGLKGAAFRAMHMLLTTPALLLLGCKDRRYLKLFKEL